MMVRRRKQAMMLLTMTKLANKKSKKYMFDVVPPELFIYFAQPCVFGCHSKITLEKAF